MSNNFRFFSGRNKMFCKLVVLLACLMGAALGEKTPVFIWGSDNPAKPALYTITEDEFAELLKPKAKEYMFVVFQEPKLSSSDFTCHKSSSRDSCFNYLKTVAPKSYYSSVENPIEAIRKASVTSESAIVDCDGNLDHDVTCQPGKAVMLDLGVLNEGSINAFSREDLLEMHDEVIAKAYNKLSENCKITAVYTRTPSTLTAIKSRRKRDNHTSSGTTLRSGIDFLLYFTELTLHTPKDNTTEKIAINQMTITDKNQTSFVVNLSGGAKMRFLISHVRNYFQMSKLNLRDIDYHVSPWVAAPTDFSYACGYQTFYSENFFKILVWHSLQMQAPFSNNTEQNFNFGEPWYGVGYFSPAILDVLVVIFFLLYILIIALTWMFALHTMDRFEDPKGKTITVIVDE